MKSSIEVELHFDELRALTRVKLEGALEEWGAVTLNRVRAYETRVGDASPTRRVSPGVHLRDSFRLSSIFQGLAGFVSGDRLAAGLYVMVYTPDENALWQELGTRGRRRKKLAAATLARQRTPSGRARLEAGTGNGGVKPLYFLRHAGRDSYADGVALVSRALL